MSSDLEVPNRWMVSSTVGPHSRMIIQVPPKGPISVDDALNLAAWILVISNSRDRFEQMVNAIENLP